MLNIIGKRYYYFAFSLFLIVPGMIILITRGIPLAIDFTGGTLIELRFESGDLPQPAEVVSLYNDLGVEDILVQTTSEGTLVARSDFLDDATRAQIIDAMQNRFSTTVEVLRFDSVGPIIGQEVAGRAALAVSVAAAIVVFYIAFAFRGVQNAFRYGICAIIAMVHDVLIVISLTAIGSVIAGWQIDALYLTALLTVIGFSAQDTIVVFDRIRENSNLYRRLDYETLVNHSIVQTLERSINTQLMTVEFILLALVLFGGITLREFSLVMLVGLISGTYSSIFVAAPLLVVWQKHEWRTWFRRGQAQASA
jgi:preprotein translocase subunit SecF